MSTKARIVGACGLVRAALAAVALCSAALLTACGSRELPPYGEALVVVDTNLPVPRVVSRLRVDVFASDGTWIATRDELRADASDFPTSFSIYTEEPSERDVFVRLRAYPDGRTIPYTGFVSAPFEDLLHEIPKGDGEPRLVVDGEDRTPAREPDPSVSVDRVVHLRLVPGERGRATILLDGACAARMPKLPRAGSLEGVESCSERGETRPVDVFPLEATMTREAPSRAGTFADDPCTPTDVRDDAVCVPGGTFVFGDRFHRAVDYNGSEPSRNPAPERIVQMTRFLMDVDEVSVGGFRAALAKGFVPPFPVTVRENDAPFDVLGHESCTFSAAPRAREDYPLNCVSWDTAEAFCKFIGGDLPTEAQWEYAAVAAARPRKTTYVWGDETPECERAVYGRTTDPADCLHLGVGPVPRGPTNDVTALGIRNLAGNVSEHVKDVFVPFIDECWTRAPRDPSCDVPFPPGCPKDDDDCKAHKSSRRGMRGGTWISSPGYLVAVDRRGRTLYLGAPLESDEGFRCVYTAR